MIPREEDKDNGGRSAATIVEALYNAGKMPDNFYYQLNGKSALENYMSWKAA